MRRMLLYTVPSLGGLLAFLALHQAIQAFLDQANWIIWLAALFALGLVAALTPFWTALARRLGIDPNNTCRQSAAHTLNQFSQSLNLIADVEPLVDEELGKLRSTLGIDRLLMLLAEEEDGPFLVCGQRGYKPAEVGKLHIPRRGRLVKWLATNECPLQVQTHPDIIAFLSAEEQKLLRTLDIYLVVPLTAMNRLVGLLLIGRIDEFSGDELEFLSQLGPHLGLGLQNALLLRQNRQRLHRLYRTERLATVGQLAAGAAHEIRNPLTSIRSTIQYLRRDYADNSDKRYLVDELIIEVDRINHIVTGLLSFARPGDLSLAKVDLSNLLKQTAALVENTAHKNKVEIGVNLPDSVEPIDADSAQLKQVFLNLFLNAIQAMPSGGKMQLTLHQAGNGYQVEIADTGVGIPPQDLERIFDPFFTTKEEGTGLGLAICHGIISRHRGQIDIESRPGDGTRVKVKLQDSAP